MGAGYIQRTESTDYGIDRVEIYADMLAESTREVFETMVLLPLAVLPIQESRPVQLIKSVSALLGLSGGLRGMLAIHCPEAVAFAICEGMLGEAPEVVDEEVKDTIGEIANMVAGGLKTRLLENECEIELAVPSLIAGNRYAVSLLSRAERLLLPLKTDAGTLLLEFKYAR